MVPGRKRGAALVAPVLVPFPALALALILAASLSSCFVTRRTVNVPLTAEKLATIVPGQTTATEVAELMGGPNEVVQLAYRQAWRYDYEVQKRAGLALIVINFLNEDTHQDRAWVFFDQDDVVTHVGTTLESGLAEFAMPWYELNH
jgi:outer membrane protein assembly factor BamE (lipoprotein component of BamABCDE complex)